MRYKLIKDWESKRHIKAPKKKKKKTKKIKEDGGINDTANN